MQGKSYRNLLDLTCFHNYYENGYARDLFLSPTSETAALIKGSKMLYKNTQHGFKMAFQAIDVDTNDANPTPPNGEPLVEVSDAVKFSFFFNFQDPATFINITDLDVSASNKFSGSKTLYFTNNDQTGDPEPLVFQLIDHIRPGVFTYRFSLDSVPAPADTIGLEMLNDDGEEVFSETIDTNNQLTQQDTSDLTATENPLIFEVPLNLQKAAKGLYTFNVKINGSVESDLTKRVYLDEHLAQNRPHGIVVLKFAAGELYGEKKSFAIEFARRSTTWKYNIVLANESDELNLDGYNFSIEDGNSAGADEYGVLTFSGTTGTETTDGKETLIFTSDSVVPFYEIPKLKLQLKKEDTEGTGLGEVSEVVKNLPNPSANSVSTDEANIYVYI